MDAPNEPRLLSPLSAPVDADVTVPGSKSYTNRALVCAALADGVSVLSGTLTSDDTAAMLDCLRALAIQVEVDERTGDLTISGCNGQLPQRTATLACRLSGTTARFITPMVCLGDGPYRVDGGLPLRARPMVDQFSALRSLGADIASLGQADHLPVDVRRGSFRGGSLQVPGNVSSQFLSGLLLAAPCFPAGVRVHVTTELVSRSYVDLTVETMRAFGAPVASTDGQQFAVTPGGYRAGAYPIEPDASAASYFFAAAALTAGRVKVKGLSRSSRQGDVAFVDILARMGCTVTDSSDGIEVRGPEQLTGVEVDMQDCSDVAQTLAAVAPFADSPTRITGIGFIRRKETDRIAAMVTELNRCGIHAVEEPDGLLIHPGAAKPARIRTYDDHRMAMSFALIGLRSPGIAIEDPGCVAKTFPHYFAALERLRR